MRDAFARALEILYPLRCGGCDARGVALCRECIDDFRMVEEASSCPVCGMWTGKRAVCGECIEEKRGFEEGCYGFYFDGRLREALHAFKFRKRKDVGRGLIALVGDKIAALAGRVDSVIPIPVTEKRLKERGFNQSFIIAEEISRTLSVPLTYRSLCKTGETLDQYTLSKKERRRNVKGIFSVKRGADIEGQRVLLVDDLFTTGATVGEAARVLTRAKVKSITLFALARTPS